MVGSKEELKGLVMKVKGESEKVSLKLNTQKTKIMASDPITSQQIDGEKVETVADFMSLGSKITANVDYNHKIKTLPPWEKSYDKSRQCIKKQRHRFADKGLYSQSCGFSSIHMDVSWTIKKAEHRRIDAFELWCWRRLLRVLCTERRSNQSILKEINPEYSLEGLMLKLKLQHFGHLMRRANSLEKTLMLERLKAKGKGDNRG